jgi:orotate phosphoribosyltransferase
MGQREGVEDPVVAHLRSAAAVYLWQMGAIRVQMNEPIKLASGNFSPIYVNCRRVISQPSFMRLFVATASLALEKAEVAPQAVAGGETAGIPFAAYLANALALPMLYVRKKPKGYGIATRVEGHLEVGTKVLLVEDLITDGGSKVGFLEAIAQVGGQVSEALVLFDRQQGGSELLAARGVRLHAVTDRQNALKAGEEAGLLTAAERRSVDAYFSDPAAWHAERGLAYRE